MGASTHFLPSLGLTSPSCLAEGTVLFTSSVGVTQYMRDIPMQGPSFSKLRHYLGAGVSGPAVCFRGLVWNQPGAGPKQPWASGHILSVAYVCTPPAAKSLHLSSAYLDHFCCS